MISCLILWLSSTPPEGLIYTSKSCTPRRSSAFYCSSQTRALNYHTVCIDVNTRKNLPSTIIHNLILLNRNFFDSLYNGRVVYHRWWTACSVVDAHLVPLLMFCYSRSLSSIRGLTFHTGMHFQSGQQQFTVLIRVYMSLWVAWYRVLEDERKGKR